MSRDMRDMVEALQDHGVACLPRVRSVGAFALAAHGAQRATWDIDLWVQPGADNARGVIAAPVDTRSRCPAR